MTQQRPRVAILLSTYNGSPYLPALLDSIAAQDHEGLRIVARDDGSSDGTLELLRERARAGRLELLESTGNLGPGKSFLALLAAVEADIYMFCDQDDVWLPGKVTSCVEALTAAGLDKPVLYHSDLTVVDAALKELHPSFMAHESVRFPAAHDFPVLCIQNSVVGCTTGLTAALRRIALEGLGDNPIAMHDWWLALCARTFGRLVYDPRPQILYRQHGTNSSGTSRRNFALGHDIAELARKFRSLDTYVSRVSAQAGTMLALHGRSLAPEQVRVLRAVAATRRTPRVARWMWCRLLGVHFLRADMNLAIAALPVVGPVLNLLPRNEGMPR